MAFYIVAAVVYGVLALYVVGATVTVYTQRSRWRRFTYAWLCAALLGVAWWWYWWLAWREPRLDADDVTWPSASARLRDAILFSSDHWEADWVAVRLHTKPRPWVETLAWGTGEPPSASTSGQKEPK